MFAHDSLVDLFPSEKTLKRDNFNEKINIKISFNNTSFIKR